MLTIRCDEVLRTTEDGKPCVILSTQLVRPVNADAKGAGDDTLGYVNAVPGEVPTGSALAKPITLSFLPDGVPLTSVSRYEVAELDCGPILLFFFLGDKDIPDSRVVGRFLAVSPAEEPSGERK
jgi:hypothetical protein